MNMPWLTFFRPDKEQNIFNLIKHNYLLSSFTLEDPQESLAVSRASYQLKTQTFDICTIQKSIIICILDEYTWASNQALKLTPLTMSSRVDHRMTWYQPCNLIWCRSSDRRPFSAVCCKPVCAPVTRWAHHLTIGVVYPYDTFQTLGWQSLASFIPETQPEGIVIVGGAWALH